MSERSYHGTTSRSLNIWSVTRTPKRHKDGIEDGAGVIEEVRDSDEEADVWQEPVLAADLLVTERAHLVRLVAVADLVAVTTKIYINISDRHCLPAHHTGEV